MIDFSHIIHSAAAVALQCAVGFTFGMWGICGALGCVWFIAREHDQAECRWISRLANGNTAAGYYQAFLAAWRRNDPRIS